MRLADVNMVFFLRITGSVQTNYVVVVMEMDRAVQSRRVCEGTHGVCEGVSLNSQSKQDDLKVT